MRRIRRISTFDKIAHEFNVVFRREKQRGRDPQELYNLLSSSQSQNAKALSKLSIAFLSISITSSLASQGLEAKNVRIFEIPIPSAYVGFTLAGLWMLICVYFVEMLCIINAKHSIINVFYKNTRFTLTQLSINSGNPADLYSPFRLGHFADQRRRISKPLYIIYFLALSSLFIPLLASYIYAFRTALGSMVDTAYSPLETPSSAGALLLLISSVAYVILFFAPTAPKKNLRTIRFGFLSRVSSSLPHPQYQNWGK